jgi:hypothetical protein
VEGGAVDTGTSALVDELRNLLLDPRVDDRGEIGDGAGVAGGGSWLDIKAELDLLDGDLGDTGVTKSFPDMKLKLDDLDGYEGIATGGGTVGLNETLLSINLNLDIFSVGGGAFTIVETGTVVVAAAREQSSMKLNPEAFDVDC